MGKGFAHAVGALAVTAAVTGAAVVTASPAGALSTGISKPTLTVVCAQPHHGDHYTAVRFRQHGHEFAGSVVVTLAVGNSPHAKAELHGKTGPKGWFRIRRTLHSSTTGPWIAGATYSWTTAIYQKTAATARRGTVTLTGSC
jgi:hypothetical protein